MRRCFLGGLAMLALFAWAWPAQALVLPADVDGDTHITAHDLQIILNAALGLKPIEAHQVEAADIAPSPGIGPRAGQEHGDGKIDVLDLVAALRYRLYPPLLLEPTFANVQKYVFNASCAFSSCHGSLGQRGNLVLEEGKAYDQLVNVACAMDEGKPEGHRMRVVPGDPDHSMLMTKLTNPGPDDGELMPRGAEVGLDVGKIDLIRRWILRGAKRDGDATPLPITDNYEVPVDPDYDDAGNVQLAAPPPGEGIQLEIPQFQVPEGTELQRNYYIKFPTDFDVDISKIEIAYNRGSHHLNIFKSDEDDLPDGSYVDTWDNVAWERWYLVVDSQNYSLGWQLPPGVAFHLKAHQQLNLQTHYVNTGGKRTYNGTGKVLINWWFAKPGTVRYRVGAMFAQNRNIVLPPHQFSTFSKVVTFPQDVKVLAMTGHFHTRGKEIIVSRWDGRQPGEEVYRSNAWADPQFKIFDQPFEVKAGQGLIYTATYYNNTDRTILFGPHVDTEEHCMLFCFFYPGLDNGKAIYVF